MVIEINRKPDIYYLCLLYIFLNLLPLLNKRSCVQKLRKAKQYVKSIHTESKLCTSCDQVEEADAPAHEKWALIKVDHRRVRQSSDSERVFGNYDLTIETGL